MATHFLCKTNSCRFILNPVQINIPFEENKRKCLSDNDNQQYRFMAVSDFHYLQFTQWEIIQAHIINLKTLPSPIHPGAHVQSPVM